MSNYWETKRVCVTGGAALIGSHLVERLIQENVGHLWVVDDLSSGKKENLPKDVDLWQVDLRDPCKAKLALTNADIIFHLACSHGGRGFVATHKLDCIDNLSLDATVFRVAREVGVEKVAFASSACAYPIDLQADISKPCYLKESDIDYNNIRQPDGAYGVGKLCGELALDAYVEAGHYAGVACRFFTVMGKRMKPNHAILALIAKTFVRQDPFPIWGFPDVIRNWTWVENTVDGMVLATEKLNRGAVNIGLEEPITVHQAVETVWDVMGWHPNTYHYLSDAPVGIVSRVSDSTKAKTLLGWKSTVSFRDGVEKIVDWYISTHKIDDVKASLERSLTER